MSYPLYTHVQYDKPTPCLHFMCRIGTEAAARILNFIVIALVAIQILLLMFKLKTDDTMIHNTSWFVILIPFWITSIIFAFVLCLLICATRLRSIQGLWTIEFLIAMTAVVLTIYTLENEGPNWPFVSTTPDQLLTNIYSLLLAWHVLVCIYYGIRLCKISD